MVPDTSLLNTQQYKVGIKGKVGQSRERSSSYWKGSLWVALDYSHQQLLMFWSVILFQSKSRQDFYNTYRHTKKFQEYEMQHTAKKDETRHSSKFWVIKITKIEILISTHKMYSWKCTKKKKKKKKKKTQKKQTTDLKDMKFHILLGTGFNFLGYSSHISFNINNGFLVDPEKKVKYLEFSEDTIRISQFFYGCSHKNKKIKPTTHSPIKNLNKSHFLKP